MFTCFFLRQSRRVDEYPSGIAVGAETPNEAQKIIDVVATLFGPDVLVGYSNNTAIGALYLADGKRWRDENLRVF